VSKIALDRYNHYYGFIDNSRTKLFFHSFDNPELDYPNLLNREVLFDIVTDTVTKHNKAVNMHLISI
jgi:hypothetical protein